MSTIYNRLGINRTNNSDESINLYDYMSSIKKTKYFSKALN